MKDCFCIDILGIQIYSSTNMCRDLQIEKERILRHSSVGLELRIRPVFDDFHRLTAKEDCDYPEHKHLNHELIISDTDNYQCTLNGFHLTLNQGEFLIIKPGDSHIDHFHRGQRHYVLHFSLSLTGSSGNQSLDLFKEGIPPDLQCSRRSGAEAAGFFIKLEEELKKGDLYSSYTQDSIFETMFWQLVRELPARALSSRFRQLSEQQDFHSRLNQIFALNRHKNMKVAKIAEKLFISERTLAYRCRELLNLSPSRAFTDYRIHKAAEQLLSERMSIKETSALFGFENPFHFSRLFKQIMGCSPREYILEKKEQ
jgi:AraC-like DNA-binding protein